MSIGDFILRFLTGALRRTYTVEATARAEPGVSSRFDARRRPAMQRRIPPAGFSFSVPPGRDLTHGVAPPPGRSPIRGGALLGPEVPFDIREWAERVNP